MYLHGKNKKLIFLNGPWWDTYLLCGNGKTSHTKSEAYRFSFRGGASDSLGVWAHAFCIFLHFMSQPGLSVVKCDHAYQDS